MSATPTRSPALARPLTQLPLNDHCAVTLQRTLRIPDDGSDHPLPPGLGAMTAYATGEDEYVVPMHRSEALWLSFQAPFWRPHALKVGLGATCGLTGKPYDPTTLRNAGKTKKQDYVVIPQQPWLDGINSGDDVVRQFVAAPLGHGHTVEEQLSDAPAQGGLQLTLFAPRKGRFPTAPPTTLFRSNMGVMACAAPAQEPSAGMGLAAGGRIHQKIREDEHGLDTWKRKPTRTLRIELVDALAFEALTGIPAPHPAPDAHSYTAHGLPWFTLLQPRARDVKATKRLRRIRSLADLEGRGPQDVPLPIPEHQVRKLIQLRGAR